MDFKIDKITTGDTLIYVMSFSDFDPLLYLSHLTPEELARFKDFKHIKRRREFVATRILRHSIFGFKHIHYDLVGAPFVEGEGFVSISHAEKLVGIALNPKYRVGLDLELIQAKAQRLKAKFLNEKEIVIFDQSNQETMTACWSAKETLYKLAGRKKLDFRTDLLLFKKEQNLWLGKIINPQEIFSVHLGVVKFKNYMITFNSTPIEITQR